MLKSKRFVFAPMLSLLLMGPVSLSASCGACTQDNRHLFNQTIQIESSYGDFVPLGVTPAIAQQNLDDSSYPQSHISEGNPVKIRYAPPAGGSVYTDSFALYRLRDHATSLPKWIRPGTTYLFGGAQANTAYGVMVRPNTNYASYDGLAQITISGYYQVREP